MLTITLSLLAFLVLGMAAIRSGVQNVDFRLGLMIIPLTAMVVAMVAVSVHAIRMYSELRRWRGVPFVLMGRCNARDDLQKLLSELLARHAREVREWNEKLLLLQRDGLASVSDVGQVDTSKIDHQYNHLKASWEGAFRKAQSNFYTVHKEVEQVADLLILNVPGRDWKIFGEPKIPPKQKV